MPIVSDDDVVGGQPRIDGTRIWVSHVVESMHGLGSLKAYLKTYPGITEAQVREALAYCSRQKCSEGGVYRHCQNCTKDDSPPPFDAPKEEGDEPEEKRDLWKLAKQLYRIHFAAPPAGAAKRGKARPTVKR